jgi:FecR protein/Putative zinc-finger
MTTRKRETPKAPVTPQAVEPLELAIGQIRQSEIPPAEAQAISDRVWQRVEQASGATADASEVAAIRGCDDYQRLIPALLSGTLTPSRTLLLEEHTRQCVPCRRALNAARAGESTAVFPTSRVTGRPRSGAFKWLAAAAVAVMAAGTGYLVRTSGPALPYGAVVESTGAGLYHVATLEPVELGAELAIGERVMSAPGESSYLRLADGSRIEVRGRTELAIEARKGTTVRVERGDVIIEAAPQGRGRLYVSTADCLVSVKGTIFAVSHGTKGSRVAVIEGEVKVDHAGREETLLAGDRIATYASDTGGGFEDDLAWSRNVDSYLALLKEVTALRQALARDLPRPELRYSSRLLDLTPDDTAFYAAFPNLVETVSEANRIVQERIAESPMLNEWWNSRQNSGAQASLEAFSGVLAQVGSYLGEEIVVSGGFAADGEMAGPLVLAELVDAAGLRSFMHEQALALGGDQRIVFLDDAAPAVPAGSSLVVWLGDDTLVAGPNEDIVRKAVARIESGTRSTPDGFKRQLAEAYRSGAEILIGADLKGLARVMGRDGDEEGEILQQLGLADARHLILQQRHVGERTENDAVLAFDGPRRGAAAWLAEPAPMGALDYVSPDAKLAAAVVFEQPVAILDQIRALASRHGEEGGVRADRFASLEESLGVSLRDDVAAALGGEVAVALDGPILPEPAWKVVVEVYDPDKLVWAMQRMLDAANDTRAAEGLARLEWQEETVGGRTYYGIAGERSIQMTFDQGYLLVGPNRGVIDRAIRFRQSGYTLASSSRFAKLLPAGGNVNFSALFYQDALALLKPLADKIAAGGLDDGQLAALEELRGQTEPTLAYAYGEEDRIVFAAGGVADLLSAGLPALLGLGGGFGLGQELGLPTKMPAADEDADPSNVTAGTGAGARNSRRPAA